MMKRLLPFILLFIGNVLCAQVIFDQYQDGKVWVKVKNDYPVNNDYKADPHNLQFSTLPFVEKLLTKYSIKKLSRPFVAAKNSSTLTNTFLIEFDNPQNVMQLISDLETSGKVNYAERVPLDKVSLTPNDPDYSSQWHLPKINASTAWNYFSTGSTVVVAIVDDAIERTHGDLSGRLWVNTGDNNSNGIDDDGNGYIDDRNGFDVADNDNNPNPPTSSYGHGTHVAGISCAASNNSIGVASIGYSVKLMSIKCTNSAAVITNGYDGIVYAAANGADVINMSWGGTGSSTTAQNVINWAYTQGSILVAGAGNNGDSTRFYPAAYNNVVSVAATDNGDLRSSFSNYGSWVDVSAPGSNIYSTTVGNTYGTKSGTSMASPLVTGLCGLMKSLNTGLTQSDIINCLKINATPINSLNPGYSGKLGAGRINASAAMQCISASLNWAPRADFTANVTKVTAGGVVSFTDMSVYNPTSWNWRFAGGTPGTFNGRTPPPITYNTPGVYTVTLVAGNLYGSDNEIKTGYITVVAGGGCAIINYPLPASWNIGNYTSGTNGYINGTNTFGDKQKAMYFDASAMPYTFITGVYTGFGKAYSSNTSKVVTLRVYDGTSGSPGTQLTSMNTTIAKIRSDVSGGKYTNLIFPNPVSLPASKKFFVSIDMSNLNWGGNPKDSLSIYSNTDGETTPSAVWEQQSDNSWHQYTTGSAWNLDISLVMHPIITDAPAIATFTQSATNICQGNSVNFNATGSTYEDTLLWVFTGGNPSRSSNVQQSVLYNTPGTYNVKLYVIGGGCDQLDSLVTTVTIKANPSVSVTSSGNSICLSGSSSLTASGATSYAWSPPTGLSSATGPTVVASPTVSTTYNVIGTGANGCFGNSNVNIAVEAPPAVSVSPVSTAICVGDSITFNASSTTGATTFGWRLQGATPSTSSSPLVTARYNTAGSYNAKLYANNSCFMDSSYTRTIVVSCASVSEIENNRELILQYDHATKNLKIVSLSLGEAKINIINSLGAVIATQYSSGSIGLKTVDQNFTSLPVGIYFIEWREDGYSSTKKVIVY